MKSGRHEKESSGRVLCFCFPSMEGSSYTAPTPRSLLARWDRLQLQKKSALLDAQ